MNKNNTKILAIVAIAAAVLAAGVFAISAQAAYAVGKYGGETVVKPTSNSNKRKRLFAADLQIVKTALI